MVSNPTTKIPLITLQPLKCTCVLCPIGISGPTGYVEPFFSNVNRDTSQILETNIRAEWINLTNTANSRYVTFASTGSNFYSPLTSRHPPYLGTSAGPNRVKIFQSDQSDPPYDNLAITSRGETEGWQGTINLNVSYDGARSQLLRSKPIQMVPQRRCRCPGCQVVVTLLHVWIYMENYIAPKHLVIK